MDRQKLSEQIRQAIEKSGLSGYRIAKETGISQSMISVFMSRKGMLSMKFLDRVADLIGLSITLDVSGNGKGSNLRAAQIAAGQNGEGAVSAGVSDQAGPASSSALSDVQPAECQSNGPATLVEPQRQR